MAHRERRELIEALERQGWTVEQRGKGYKATPPGGGRPVFFHATTGGYRSTLNLRALLRRHGADL
jgi:hypothetical protein